ncbi:hypothetical protein [Halegenticoccus tardaugens]|uniref:hypothetical protein n=1 Tax=Halegenticoccus tardaugens TaxID=2071624 RepID=UPI00100C1B0D|nr:hypothetical protein [Halegenticoccus tardaugens]
MAALDEAIARVRKPEYTGENRCAPCTAVNVFVAAAVAVALTLASFAWVGLVAFVAFLAVIYARGYLVPGTPALTKRYFPAWVLRLFGKQPPVDRSLGGGRLAERERVSGGGEADETPFELDGVVRNDNAADLTAEFADAWTERIRDVRERGVEPSDVRALFDAETISRHGARSFVVDGNKSVRWESEAALVADVAAAEILRERLDRWIEFDRDRRQSVLTGLRLCLGQCPSCDGSPVVTEDRVDPCCQKPHLVAQSVCRDCDAALADAAVADRGEAASVRSRLLLP